MAILITVIGVESAMIIFLFVIMRMVIWPMYMSAKNESNELKIKIEAITEGRDGWRTAAERTLVLAQLSKDITQRATRMVTEVEKIHVPS